MFPSATFLTWLDTLFVQLMLYIHITTTVITKEGRIKRRSKRRGERKQENKRKRLST